MDPIPDQQFKTLFESAPGLNLVLLPDFTITAVSEAYLQATMTERETILGRNLFEVFPDNPDDINATGVSNLRVSLNYVLEHGKPHTMAIQKYDIRRQDGSFEERHWSPLNSPVFNTEQQISYIIHNVQDVTASVKAKDQLKKRENDFQLLVNNVKDYAIFLLDKEGCVASWNKGAENIKGYTATEIIGKPMDIFYTPEDIELGTPLTNLKISLQKGHLETEGWRLRKDGSLFYANVVFTSLIDDRGYHYGFAKVTKDITEKRKNEERIRLLASITNNIQDPVISSDNNFLITRWNGAAEKLLEWKSEEVIGKTTVEVLKTIYPYQTRNEILAVIARKGIWQGELLYHTRSGRQVNVIATASKLKDAEGKESGNLILVRDITERKRAEEKLKEFEHFFNNSNDLSCIANREGYFEILNSSFEKVLGYSQQELSENPFLDFVHPDDIPATLQEYEKLKSGAAVIHFFNRYRKKDGNYLWFDWNATPNPATGKLYCIARDITDRRKAEDALNKLNEELECKVKERTETIKRSEKQYRYLFENNPMPMWVISLESFSFLDVNEMAVMRYGYSKEEFLSMTAMDIRPVEERQSFLQADHSLKLTGENYNRGIWNHRKKDGSIIQVEIIAHEIIFEGISARLILANDITDRIAAEQKLTASEVRFRSLIENSAEGITLTDVSFNTFYRSPSALKIIGEDSVADLARRSHPEDRDKLVKARAKILNNPGLPVAFEGRFITPSGGYLWLEGTLTNLFHVKGVEAIVANYRDVTKRKEAEEEVIRSEESYRTIMERVSDGFVAIDTNWNYTYVNKEAGVIMQRDPESLMEKNIWEEFPEGIGKPFHQAYYRAMENQEYIYLEEYYAPFDLWLENHIYPSPEGLSIFFKNITGRKQAERQVIESEENLKAIFDNSSEGFILTDESGIVKVFNDRTRESILMNMAAGMTKSSSIFDYTDESRKDFFRAIFARVLQGETIEYDRLYSNAGKPDTWINLTYNPVRKGAAITGVCITGRDITQMKMAERQKEFDHNNLTSLINNTGDMMWSVDRNFRLITSNSAFDTTIKAITGTIPEKGADLLKMASSKEQLKRYKGFYNRAFSGETFTKVEHIKAPEDFWSEISFNPIYEGENVVGTACFSRDITDRKKSEQQLEDSFHEKQALAERMSTIINTLPANIALLDKKGNIVDVNDAWRKFADNNGFFGNNYCIGESYIGISKKSPGKGKEDGKKVASGIRSVLTGKLKEFVYEYPCHSPNVERWFRMVVTPLQENGKGGAVVMHVDISELRILEKERMESSMDEQKKLTLAILQGQEKERNHLGRELHDNINQILAATRMFLSMAAKKNEPLRDALKYPMELLDTSIEEIRTLCQGMVTPLKNIKLEDMIKDLLVKMSKDQSIEYNFRYAVPEGCLSDDLKLNIYRIMQELVNNIVKYAAATKVNVSATVKDNILKVSASDNGKGFNMADKRKGIGISNMINRMQSFNGNVEIKSSEGKGCQTVITVPC